MARMIIAPMRLDYPSVSKENTRVHVKPQITAKEAV
jgi:hypothetical protein